MERDIFEQTHSIMKVAILFAIRPINPCSAGRTKLYRSELATLPNAFSLVSDTAIDSIPLYLNQYRGIVNL